jgi:hypothetical protein
MRNRDYGELTYTFEDVVRTLNSVQPYDWEAYLKTKVLDVAANPPLEGLTKGGYNLVFTDEPTAWIKSYEKSSKSNDLTYSGGFVVGNDGKNHDSPLGQLRVQRRDDRRFGTSRCERRKFDGDGLKSAIKAAKGTSAPVKLLVKSGEVYRTLDLDWHDGLRYPRLEKVGKGQGTLDALLAPRK